MRILVHFRGEVLEDRGTPLRCRNIVATLAKRQDVEVMLLSRDESAPLQEQLPVAHGRLDRSDDQATAVQAEIDRFRPHVLYGQTHKAMRDFAQLPDRQGAIRVVDLHGDYPAERLEQPGRPLVMRIGSYLRERMREATELKRMDAFTVVGEALAARVRPLDKPVQILWGGVDPSRFRPHAAVPSTQVRVAYAGNFRPYQGVDDLLTAMTALRQQGLPFHLTLIGDIDQFPATRAHFAAALADGVTFVGQVPYAQVPALLGEADILVIPRPADRAARFGFPSKLPEYLALGKPVVITDVGEHRQVVQHMQNGVLIPPGSPEALTAALITLQDEELRRRMGTAARRAAEERLSWFHIGEQLVTFLTTLSNGQESIP